MDRKHARIVDNSRLSVRNDISFVKGRNNNFLRIFENRPIMKTLKIHMKFLLHPIRKLMLFLTDNRLFSTILACFEGIFPEISKS